MEPYDWAHTNTSKPKKIVTDSIFEVTYLGSAFVQSYKDLYMHLLAFLLAGLRQRKKIERKYWFKL